MLENHGWLIPSCKMTSGQLQQTLAWNSSHIISFEQTIMISICNYRQLFDAISYYLHGSCGILLVFDLTSSKSFDNALGRWNEFIHNQSAVNIPVVLVGNKCDCFERRQISNDRIQTICDEMELSYFDVSAKTRLGVNVVFEELLKETSN